MNRVKGLMLLLCLVMAPVAAIPVNVNTASAEEISIALFGVGKFKAQAIVEYRQKHGAFKSVQALKKVRGIGQGVLDGNHGDILIE